MENVGKGSSFVPCGRYGCGTGSSEAHQSHQSLYSYTRANSKRDRSKRIAQTEENYGDRRNLRIKQIYRFTFFQF